MILLIGYSLFSNVTKALDTNEQNKSVPTKTVNSNQKSNDITMDDLKLGDLNLNITRKKLFKIMQTKKNKLIKDESNSQSKQKYESLEEYLTYQDGTIILLLDNTVASISVSSPNYKTPRGLKVGDSESDLIKLYGKYSYSIKIKRVYFYGAEEYDVFILTVVKGIIKVIEVKLVD